MHKVFLGTACFLFSALLLHAQSPLEKGLQSINRTSAEAIVEFLADDELQGREAGMHGSRVAARYIVSCLKEAGIRPLDKNGYYQPFEAYAKERQQRGRWQVHPDSVAVLKQSTHRSLKMDNVLAYIPGKRSDEYVIVGAHFDHLGVDETLADDKIYNGADDNASGVSAVLQIARAFALSGEKPLRNVIFAFWDGEEKGLLGSKHFVQHCPFLKPAFGEWLKRDITRYGLQLQPDYRPWDNPVGGSDNASFARSGIPVIWYHTDGHPDYHQPSDHAALLNWEKVVEITKASFLNVWNLANESNY